MIRAPRVVILSTSALNPFIEAWAATIRASGATVATLIDGRRTGERSIPGVLTDAVLLTPDGPEDWPDRVTALLGGPPDVAFDWWGTGALARDVVVRQWPGVPRVLCVDTYPNASRLRAEARDYAQANILLPRAAGLVVASRAMRAVVDRTTAGRFRSLPGAVVHSPFPLAAHAGGAPAPRPAGPLRFCFTGRSDYLFASDAGMSKDAVGPQLTAYLERGAEVHVLHPGNETAAEDLRRRGFLFYPSTPRDEILSGGLADVIGRYDGHLVVYAQTSGTIRRRIANSLSTRFATAVCSPAPIVAPHAAGFVDELFDRHPIGFRSDDPDEVIDRIGRDADRMRGAWHAGHEQWAGEASAGQLAHLWDRVRRG